MSLAHTLLRQAGRLGDTTALSEYGPHGRSLSWAEWADAARACAAALIDAGHAPGERIAVYAGNTVLWPVADIGVQLAGMVCVGVFPTAAPVQLEQILRDAGATAVFVDTRERLDAVQSVYDRLPALRAVVADVDAAADDAVTWDRWLSRGAALHVDGWPAVQPEDDAAIIYTSGSSGEPKGARLSHAYIAASAESLVRTLDMQPGGRSLSFLPFSHAAERVFGHARRIVLGEQALLLADHRDLWAAAASFRPTVFGGLPRFYEKLCDVLLVHSLTLGGAEAAEWDRALDLGRERSRLRRAGEALSAALDAEWEVAIAPHRALLASRIGDAVRIATSGGATLPPHVAETLDACGLTVYGAYGLTEHLCVASHRPATWDFTGVGPAMHGTDIRIGEDDEILVRRCDLTFSGYLNRAADSAMSFTDDGEWLRTGDQGRLDAHGRLFVTGRLKELIALSTGKKVAPAPIEARLALDPWIAQAMLYGEGRSFLTALITLRRDAVERWAAEQGIVGDFAVIASHESVRNRVGDAIAAVNADLSSPEQVKRFVILDREFAAERDEVTPTLKLRRPVIARNFAAHFDALYEERPA